jgi:hypothetical protein
MNIFGNIVNNIFGTKSAPKKSSKPRSPNKKFRSPVENQDLYIGTGKTKNAPSRPFSDFDTSKFRVTPKDKYIFSETMEEMERSAKKLSLYNKFLYLAFYLEGKENNDISKEPIEKLYELKDVATRALTEFRRQSFIPPNKTLGEGQVRALASSSVSFGNDFAERMLALSEVFNMASTFSKNISVQVLKLLNKDAMWDEKRKDQLLEIVQFAREVTLSKERFSVEGFLFLVDEENVRLGKYNKPAFESRN